MKPTSSAANIQFSFGTTSKEHKRNCVHCVARLKPGRNFKVGPNKHQPELDCQFSPQHFHLLSPPSCPHFFYGNTEAICTPTCPGGGGCLPGAGRCVAHPGWVGAACSAPSLPAKLQTHMWPFPTSSSHGCFQGF